MNIPKYSLENRKVIYFFLAILLIGGVISFFKLPKKEDAPFVIKTAVYDKTDSGSWGPVLDGSVSEIVEKARRTFRSCQHRGLLRDAYQELVL